MRLAWSWMLPAACLLAGGCAGPAPRGGITDELDELRVLAFLEGDLPHDDYRRGQFRLLSELCLTRGTRADFERMLCDETSLVRKAGLACLAWTDPAAAVAPAQALLTDHRCAGWNDVWDSPAAFAWRMLCDRDCLRADPSRGPRPLLSARELTVMNLRLLADNDAWLLHEGIKPALARQLADEAGRLPALRQLVSRYRGLSPLEIVKAVGRLEPSPQQLAFLLAVMRDSTVRGEELLATGSALCRHSSPDALQAVAARKTDLNDAAPGAWGDRFARTLTRQLARADLLGSIRQAGDLLGANAEIVHAIRRSDSMALWDHDSIPLATEPDDSDLDAVRCGAVQIRDGRIMLTDQQWQLLLPDGASEPADLAGIELVMAGNWVSLSARSARIDNALASLLSALPDEPAWSTWAETAATLRRIARNNSPEWGRNRIGRQLHWDILHVTGERLRLPVDPYATSRPDTQPDESEAPSEPAE